MLFDISMTDTDGYSPIYLSQAPDSVLFRAEAEKKQKYSAAAIAQCAYFIPLCFSVDGVVGSELAA